MDELEVRVFALEETVKLLLDKVKELENTVHLQKYTINQYIPVQYPEHWTTDGPLGGNL